MTREAETRSKLIAQITSAPGWELPEPQAAVSIETAVAFALAFADAEAAAMRERAAKAMEALAAEKRAAMHPEGHPMAGGIVDGMRDRAASAYDHAAAAIRALPAAGEVGRG